MEEAEKLNEKIEEDKDKANEAQNEELESALNVVKQVCGAFNGNLKQHENIQGALQCIEKNLKK